MLVVLSPAKTINESGCTTACEQTSPIFEERTQELLRLLQSCSKAELQTKLGVSSSLARQAPVPPPKPSQMLQSLPCVGIAV